MPPQQVRCRYSWFGRMDRHNWCPSSYPLQDRSCRYRYSWFGRMDRHNWCPSSYPLQDRRHRHHCSWFALMGRHTYCWYRCPSSSLWHGRTYFQDPVARARSARREVVVASALVNSSKRDDSIAVHPFWWAHFLMWTESVSTRALHHEACSIRKRNLTLQTQLTSAGIGWVA